MQGKMKVPLVFFRRDHAAGSSQSVFKAWIRSPLILVTGDEIEVDLPLGAFAVTNPESKLATVRAAGRIISVAVHADERLWYEFVAESTTIVSKHDGETNSKYPSLSISR